MAALHIHHPHALGLVAARRLAVDWTAQAQERWGLACRYSQGEAQDRADFSRTGISGTLQVAGDHFALELQLGFLLSAYRDRIEAEIRRNLQAWSEAA